MSRRRETSICDGKENKLGRWSGLRCYRHSGNGTSLVEAKKREKIVDGAEDCFELLRLQFLECCKLRVTLTSDYYGDCGFDRSVSFGAGYDLFLFYCGSGTSLVEGVLMGLRTALMTGGDL